MNLGLSAARPGTRTRYELIASVYPWSYSTINTKYTQHARILYLPSSLSLSLMLPFDADILVPVDLFVILH